MKKMFLAGPFKAWVDPSTQMMASQHIAQFQSIIDYFEDQAWQVHSAYRREQWGKDFMSPAQCTQIDYQEIQACDYVVAFPGSPASPGTHIEIGWASAMGKPLILLLEEGRQYAHLIHGLPEVARVKMVTYPAGSALDPAQIEQQIQAFEVSYATV